MANTPYYTKAETEAKIKSFKQFIDPSVTSDIYGIEYDTTVAAPEVTRIGELNLHASLPVQSKLRRCVLADDGTVNYYLDKNNSTLREDGTAADLTGAHGQVMVEIPRHWRKFETESNKRRAYISLTPFAGAHEVQRMYVSAYKAALDRTTSKLSSVVNTSVNFRGGNNSATNDANAATLLGKPATAISRINYRQYAQNRGSLWLDMDYQARKTIYWLITIEYATRNHQGAVNAATTAEGYKQGALGTGPTDISSGDWSTFNGYYPLYDCGLTNSLGNNTGEVPVTLQDFPTSGLTKATQVNSYRGVENFFGDIWEWTNGVNIDNGASIARVYAANASKKSDSDFLGYRTLGVVPQANGYIAGIIFGEEGDILPSNISGGSSTTYFSDYFYQNFASKELKGLLFGGVASNGSAAGSACVSSYYAPSTANAAIGSRLCFFAR